MKTKIFYILTTAVITLTAFYIGRNTVPTKTTMKTVTAMPEKVDLSNKDQFNYICNFMSQISDWNCGGGENLKQRQKLRQEIIDAFNELY